MQHPAEKFFFLTFCFFFCSYLLYFNNRYISAATKSKPMEQIGTKIASALVKAQKGFAPAIKAAVNPQYGSKYADLASCIDAVLDSLNENGIALNQIVGDVDGGVSVETRFIHESGESVTSGKISIPAQKANAHGYGSALTYARRYSLMSAAGIAPEDDDGNAASAGHKGKVTHCRPSEPAPSIPSLSNEEVETIKAMAAEAGFDIARIEKFYGVSLAEISGAEYGKIMLTLENKKQKESK